MVYFDVYKTMTDVRLDVYMIISIINIATR